MPHLPPLRVLLVEDNDADARLVREFLSDPVSAGPLRIDHVTSLAGALLALARYTADIVLLDLSLPDSVGLATLAQTILAAPDIPIVVLTGLDDRETGLAAVNAGAQDYLVKGQGDAETLARAMAYAIERKRHERLIEELGRMNELLLKSLGEGVMGLDLDGRITFVNPALVRLVGWKPDEMIGRDPHSLFHERDAAGNPNPHAECPIMTSLKDGEVRHIDGDVLWNKDREAILVDYVVTPVREKGVMTGAVVAFRDVRDRQEAFNVLRRQLGVQQQLIDALPLPFFYTDDTAVLIGCNRAFAELLGRGRIQLLGEPVHDLLPDSVMGQMLKIEAGVSERSSQIARLPDGDGRTRTMVCHLTAVRDGTDLGRGVVGILVDPESAKAGSPCSPDPIAA